MIVKVPASSANLGPGFDCFGVAWDIYNEISFEKSDCLEISGCEEAYRTADNLAFVAYKAVLDHAGIPCTGARIDFRRTDIPVSRGLGSSAALICGGVVAANKLYGLSLSADTLFSIATAVEGHPDNIAPAMFGGLTASAMAGSSAVTTHFPLHESLHFTVLIPDFPLSTAKARSVLPEQYSRADAVFNVSRAALLLKALEAGDEPLLRLGLQDRIHQPYRFALVPGFDLARDAAMRCGGLGICISGAGSTLLCVAKFEDFTGKMQEEMGKILPSWVVRPVKPDLLGTREV